MNWSFECVEDPTDALNEEDEYMFDEYIDMLIDRARGHDQANPYIGLPYWIYRGKHDKKTTLGETSKRLEEKRKTVPLSIFNKKRR